ncbi:hypothetical protein Hanom_Chr09g00793581 [Helianthus anomalus]
MTDICHFLCFVLDEYLNGMKRRLTLKSGMRMKKKMKSKQKNPCHFVFQTSTKKKILQQQKTKSKLQKSSFMLTLYYKVCPLSSINTKNVLDVCKPLHAMSFITNSVTFNG